MERTYSKVEATKPKNVFLKPIKADFKQLFKSLSKGIGHMASGKWEELGTDTVEALSAIGLATEPGELAYLLVKRSIIQSLFDLVGESASLPNMISQNDSEKLVEQMDFSISVERILIGKEFFDRPANLQLLVELAPLFERWLEAVGLPKSSAKVIVDRWPSYFTYALNQEWRRNAKSYRPLKEALDTPFAKASEREWAWTTYSALLQRRIQESIFDEPISLCQMYIPLNAYYFEEIPGKDLSEEIARSRRKRRRIVVSLQEELEQWLQKANSQDALRVISGGPGSGKSTFARIFAARISMNGNLRVLYVPLHLIDASKDLVEEVGRFVRAEGVLLQNPLDPDSPEPNLVIIFDGLDELASQGKAAAEIARAFVHEVEKTVEKRNLQSVKLRVLISGRELIVQENESEFRRPRQVMNLLPYYVGSTTHHGRSLSREDEEYLDPSNLLKIDLRDQWWKKYGALTHNGYKALPSELSREDLDEITAQPLLNYLVALSFTREKIDFKRDINLNLIYSDLVAAVYERSYEKHRPYGPIRHMKLEDFLRVLEEIGLAAWHGDGRTTTVREIEKHCRASGLGKLLDVFQEGAQAGVTRLLAAFFFRKYGQRYDGDPTFVFTHKSFGEYLSARRVVRAIEKVMRELDRRDENPDEGWDDRDALKHWAQICGESAISKYLHVFLLNEMMLRQVEQVDKWQDRLSKLFSHMLRHGMPMEQLQIGSFKEALFQSRNAEEGLLVVLNSCANVSKKVSPIKHYDRAAFGSWFKRIIGQRIGAESSLVSSCLSFLDLSETFLNFGDFYHTDLHCSMLRNAACFFANFSGANLRRANFMMAQLSGSSLERADLEGAHLEGAVLGEASIKRANLVGANLQGAHLSGANLSGADLAGANLEEADLLGANLVMAKLQGANLEKVYLKRANLRGAFLGGAKLGRANLMGANLQGASLGGADLGAANLLGTNLEGANFMGANLGRANLGGASLGDADLRRANLQGANLRGAKLERASLGGANLEEAELERASLGGTYLGRANLKGANLYGANLARANLQEANLGGANLEKANLEGANLYEANLQGANLYEANLEGANLYEANLQGANLPSTKP